MENKPRILILITIQFSVRYIIRTGILDELKKNSEPLVLLGWRDIELENELSLKGIEVSKIPVAKYGKKYNRVRNILNIWHMNKIKSPSIAIDRRRHKAIVRKSFSIKSEVLRFIFSLLTKIPIVIRHYLKQHEILLWQDTNAKEIKKYLLALKPNLILSLTPFLREEQILLSVAQNLNIKLITSLLSFDNITTRGWIPVIFDHYLLWNDYNKQELLRIYPAVNKKNITVIGPLQFDFYWDSSYLWTKEKWQKILGIPPERPIILFGGGFHSIIPNEHFWLKQLDKAISDGKILYNPVILFRKHPVDPIDRWLPILEKSQNIIYDNPWKEGQKSLGQTNIKREDIEKLCSTLKWSDVHVNASSTMTIDGAIFDRPQIGPAYDDRPGKPFERVVKELYLREHYLPISNSGGLAIANSLEELINEINNSLTFPEYRKQGRQKMITSICQYSDGKSAFRFIHSIEKIIKENYK